MRRTVIGILAHVDAGKTTLSEALLYLGGAIRTLGRVDHRDAFLDTDPIERERGITIFSKQAVLRREDRDWEAVLLDTPGHADFSAETERVLRVLDCAVLVVSGTDGVQAHTLTLWRLLEQYNVPVALFVNKMDLPGADRDAVLDEIHRRLDGNCLDFTEAVPDKDHSAIPSDGEIPDALPPALAEETALCGEDVLERYMETGGVTWEDVRELVSRRKLFPCLFGSALRLEGVSALLEGLARFAPSPVWPDAFGARIFKISRDGQGNRLAWMKLTGGSLRVKTLLTNRHTDHNTGRDSDRHNDRDTNRPEDGAAWEERAVWEDKAEQLRIYSGEKYQAVETVPAGCVCAVTGLRRARAGEGLGFETDWDGPLLEPVLCYRLLFRDGTDPRAALPRLRELEEEDPLLRLAWEQNTGSIQVRLMGEVQMEILQRILRDRFGWETDFGEGSILYRETIAAPVQGVGHFEPLRHYAEVRLLLEPLPPGSGVKTASLCPEDALSRNWQRLIATHLTEREHPGVLTGSPLTDVKISILAGRAHVKHTEGGDFREAVGRAVRQGLMGAENILLEPWYAFRLELPADRTGRAMTDLQRMEAEVQPPETAGGETVLTGEASVSRMASYAREVAAYTKGLGRLSLRPAGYRPCTNQAEVVERIGYDPERDPDHPPGSVFCTHGAGILVPWQEVPALAHTEDPLGPDIRSAAAELEAAQNNPEGVDNSQTASGRSGGVDSSQTASSRPGGVDSSQTASSRPGGVDSSESSSLPRGGTSPANSASPASGTSPAGGGADFAAVLTLDRELESIFRRTYGEAKPRREAVIREARPDRRTAGSPADRTAQSGPEYLLVDGYNIIFAWEDLTAAARENLDAARILLCDLLCGYQAVRGCVVIAVFDAYKVKGNPGSHEKYHNIDVVYTKEAETADAYIERATYEIGRHHRVRVATSDGPEQLIILGHGALRVSASMFREEMEGVRETIAEILRRNNRSPPDGAVRTALERAVQEALKREN